MPLLVEVMTSKRAHIRICLMITFIVKAFERIRIWFTLLSFKVRRIHLKVYLAASDKITVIFNFVWSVTFNILRILETASECGIILLLAILALGYA